MSSPRRIILGVSGSSGAPYGPALLRELLAVPDLEVHLIVTASATIVMREEMGLEFAGGQFDVAQWLAWNWAGTAPMAQEIPTSPNGPTKPPPTPDLTRVILHRDGDVAAGPASGSFRTLGMIICPCSMRTLATIATGTGASLITRAADATLKERRRLVLVPRETPLNLIHLRNMVTVTEAGATVLPAMPGFYHRPQTLDDIVRFIVMKVMDAIGLDAPGVQGMRWKESPSP
jgi:4-hydroxy-3-polyprenylbenzoate decarboxylase